MREKLAGPQGVGQVNFPEYYKGTFKGPVNAISDFTSFVTRGNINIPKFEAGTDSEALGMRNGIAVIGAAGLRGAKVGGVTAKNLSETTATNAAVKGIPSQIDRVKFNKERQEYWKNEAKTKPSNYSSKNLQRMDKGRAPIGSDGKPIELRHKDGIPNGTIEPMTQTEHRIGPNYLKNHPWMGIDMDNEIFITSARSRDYLVYSSMTAKLRFSICIPLAILTGKKLLAQLACHMKSQRTPK